MELKKNVDKYVYLSNKNNDLPFPHISMTSYPFLNAAVYSYSRKEENRRLGWLAGLESYYCRRYMAKAKCYNIYVDLKGVLDGHFDTSKYPESVLHRILQEMADHVAKSILKNSPKNMDFRTREDDWQPLTEWYDAESSFKPIY